MLKTRSRGNMVAALVMPMAIGIVLAALAGRASAQVRQETAMLTIVVGDVEVMRVGTTMWNRASVGMRVAPGDQIRALERSEAEMLVTDSSVVKVGPETRLQVRRLDADATTGSRETSFHLVVGTIRAVVAKAAMALVAARQGGFSMTTPTAVAAVRGSDGVINYNPRTRATTVLSFSGVWATSEPTTGRLVLLVQGTVVRTQPGQQGDAQPMPVSFQLAILTNFVIRTPTTAGVTTAPVTPGTPAAPLRPATLPPLTADELRVLIPPVPDPGAPAPPANQIPALVPGIVPESPRPRTTLSDEELGAVFAGLNDPRALQLDPPSETAIATASGQELAPRLPIILREQRIERPISPAR